MRSSDDSKTDPEPNTLAGVVAVMCAAIGILFTVTYGWKAGVTVTMIMIVLACIGAIIRILWQID